MIIPSSGESPRSLFRPDEPVVQSHPLMPAARRSQVRMPLFGDSEFMDFNGVVQPARQPQPLVVEDAPGRRAGR